MTTEPRVRSVLVLSAVVVLLAGGALALGVKQGAAKGVKPVPKAAAAWKDVDRLVNEQKFEEAAKAAEALLAAAKAKKRWPGPDVQAISAPTTRPASTAPTRTIAGCCASR